MGTIHVYTGHGKGKSSASLGMTARMIGHGGRVLFIQFFKFENSDKDFLEAQPQVTFRQFRYPGDYFKSYSEEERAQLAEELRAFLTESIMLAEEGGYDLIVLDELVYAVHMRLITEGMLRSVLLQLSRKADVIITGRNMPHEILAIASYVTECVHRKHPYDEGVPARRGIDY